MIPALVMTVLSGSAPELCRQVHHLADGRVIVSRVGVDAATASADAHSTRSSGSHSSVSVSSAGGGTSSASASSSADGKHRSVRVTRDANGCTVTIDDRPSQE